MAHPKSRRRPPLLQALAWFLPGWIAVAVAVTISHPLTLVPLLLANTLTMAAVCHAIGFDPEPRFWHTVLRRGVAHLAVFTGYCALVLVLVAWPMLKLTQAASLPYALALALALGVALVALWRVWPAFALLFVWDDAYPTGNHGSWIFTAAARSLTFGRHLSREEHFFTHFLPAALVLLVLAFSAVALTGLYGVLPSELRTAAMALYGLVLLPLGCLVLANRTLRAMLVEGRAPRDTSRERERAMPATEVLRPIPAPAASAPLSEQERTAGTPEQAAALLAATREGDIDRALALVEAGADPDTAPAPTERDQRPVLMLAALLPDTQLLRALIAKGADVNRRSGGLTPLLAATRDSWHGRAEAVLTLLSNGADAQAADSEGNTPLHGAVLSAEPTVAAMLLDGGAALNALNQAGDSPLTVACRTANWPLARFLLERGAKPSPAGGEPALVAAAGIHDDDPEGVKLLLKHRAAVNAVDSRHRSALMVAAAEGHEQIARVLRQAGAQIELTDRHGSNALMEAARAGANGIVQLLAEAQPDARRRDSHGRDALTLACQSPHARAETVRALLALGADPRVPGSDGRSALDHAAAAGRWDLVALLDPQTPLPASLHHDATLSGADTPLHLLDALRYGQWALVSTFSQRVREWPQAQLAQLYLELAAPGHQGARRWLLEHGLSAEARLQPQLIDEEPLDGTDAEGDARASALPPLGRRLFDALLAQLPASIDALRDLLQAGASPAGNGLLAAALCPLDPQPAASRLLQEMLQAGADPFGVDNRGRTPLHLAAATHQLDVLQQLLACGCDPNARDASGRTPLFAALEHGAAALPLVRALVAHGADPEATDRNGETPLGLALEHAEIERWLNWGAWSRPARPLRAQDLPAAAAAGAEVAVSRLLELGFPVDTRDAQGATALLRACGAGHRAIAAQLLQAGANPTLSASSGVTPLAAAVSARREDTVTLLLEQGVAADQRLPGDTTALMIAAALGYPEIVELLLTAGAEVNSVDEHGHASLHAAAQFCFGSSDSLRARRLLDVLLKRGAEVNRADHKGQTPLLLLLGAHQRPGSECDATHLGALVPVLLEAGAQLAHADQRGVSALHACAMHALLSPARVLLARGADRQAVDAFGRTAAEVARAIGYVDIAHELAARAGAIPSVRQTLRQPAQPSDG